MVFGIKLLLIYSTKSFRGRKIKELYIGLKRFQHRFITPTKYTLMNLIDFLGELKHIKSERLIDSKKKDEIEDFFLTLGIFYNDLKSFTFYLVQMKNQFSHIDLNKISVETGEYYGMECQLQRLIAGTLHEFFDFLDEKKGILKTEEFHLLYKKLNIDLKSKWDAIVEIAINRKASKELGSFSNVLVCIRNNLAFHYKQSGKCLKEGFINFFFNDPKGDSNEKAYYSIGDKMRDTRFFYCDAAAKRYMKTLINKSMDMNEYMKEFLEVIENVNFTIMALMKEYISQRRN